MDVANSYSLSPRTRIRSADDCKKRKRRHRQSDKPSRPDQHKSPDDRRSEFSIFSRIRSGDDCTKRKRRRRQSVKPSRPNQQKRPDDRDCDSEHNSEEDEEYIKALINLKKLQFLEDHYNDEWLRDIYHPFHATCLHPRKEMLDAVISNCVNRHYVVRVRSEKHGWVYSCQADGCRKVFQELVFLYKHLRGKHPELVREMIVIAGDGVYFHNYMTDPNAPYPEQIRDLPSAPPVVVPITGAGLMGPFVTASKEITLQMMEPSKLNNLAITCEVQSEESCTGGYDDVCEIIILEDNSP